MKKKILVLIMIVLLILSLAIITVLKKEKKMTYSYDNLTFTYDSNKKEKNIYKNTLYIYNKGKTSILNNIKLKFYIQDKLLEEISVKVIDVSSKKNKMQFDSKNDLKKSTRFEVLPNNVFSISSIYNDGTILINDFLEKDNNYVFNLKNLTEKKLENYKITVNYIDESNNALYTKKFQFDLNPNEIISIVTLKGDVSPKKVEYIEIIKE